LPSIEKTILGRFLSVAESRPEHAAFIIDMVGEETVVTYRELRDRASRISQDLTERGIGKGDLVLVVHPTGRDLFACFLGAMMAGAIPSIIPPPTPKQRAELFWASHNELFHLSMPRAILLSEAIAIAYREYLPAFADRLRVVEEILADKTLGPAGRILADSGDIAFLQHSSGTTALKKGVALTHDAVLLQIDAYAKAVGFSGDSIIASWLPLYHDMGLIACLIMPLCMGATTVVQDPLEWSARPSRLLAAIGRHRATHAWLPNFAFEHLCNGAPTPTKFDLSSLQRLIDCSEPCRISSLNRFSAHFSDSGLSPAALSVCYAMAETVFAVSQTPLGATPSALRLKTDCLSGGAIQLCAPDELGVDVVSCGPVLSIVNLTIVNDERVELGENCVGEVRLSGETLFSEYYRRPDLSRHALKDGWYHTGDLGFVSNGELYIVGRKDDLVISFGRNVLAHELEAALSGLTGLIPGRSVAFGIDSVELGTRELAIMCEAEDGQDSVELQKTVRKTIEAIAGVIPRHIKIVSRGTLIKSTSGKLSRSANRDLLVSGRLPS